MRQKADSIKLRGYLEYCLRDARTGKVVSKGKTRNTVTAIGRGWVMARILSAATGSSSKQFAAIAVGQSSGNAPTSNDVALQAYTTIKSIMSESITSATNSAVTYKAVATWDSNESIGQIAEFALWNHTTTGATNVATMFNRVTTSAFTFSNTNTLAVTITITN